MASNIHITYTKKELLRDGNLYKKMWDENPAMLKYSEKEISKLLKGYNEYISKTITSTRDGVALPLHMGVMFSGTYGKRENKVDVNTSKKIEKEVTYPNHDTDGYGAMTYYITDVTKTRFALGKFWGFGPCDGMKKNLAKHYVANWKIYAHVYNSTAAWKLFTQNKLKEYAKERGKEVKELYDEFDFDNID